MDAPVSATRNGQGSQDGRVGAAFADPAHTGPLPNASFPELIGRLINDVSDLADRQIELAKQEVGEAKDEAIKAVLAIAIGAVTFAWIGWVLGLLVPGLAAWIAWKRFISGGIRRARGIWPPLPRTRDTLKEDLAWVQHQRTRSAR